MHASWRGPAPTSNTMACTALALLGFFTAASPPPRMRLSTSTNWPRTPASSGGGKYCSTRRHLT